MLTVDALISVITKAFTPFFFHFCSPHHITVLHGSAHFLLMKVVLSTEQKDRDEM